MKSVIILSCLVTMGSIQAQQDPAKCVHIEANEARLACFDAIFKGNKSNAADIKSKETITQNQVENTINETTSLSSPSTINTSEIFGLEHTVTNVTPDSIQSVAKGNFKEWKRKMTVKLENGQIWQITNSTSLYYKIENPKVVIEKGVLGAFYMEIEGINRRLKVKRIE